MSLRPEYDEQELLLFFREGDERGFNFLYDKYCEPIYFFAFQLTGNREAAEDITAEAFVKLWQKRASIQDSLKIKSYLYAIVHNAAADHNRHARKEEKNQTAYSSYQEGDTETPVLQLMIRTEFMQQLYNAMDELPSQCRKIMKLSYIEGKSYREIALAMNLSPKTVRNQKLRGIVLIRKMLHLNILLLFFYSLGLLFPSYVL